MPLKSASDAENADDMPRRFSAEFNIIPVRMVKRGNTT